MRQKPIVSVPRSVKAQKCSESWWLNLDRSRLNAEAKRRWPAATTGEKFSGVLLQQAQRAGTL